METVRSVIKDVESMIPSFSYAATVKEVPKTGEAAPSSPLQLRAGQPSILIFTRHMGCPFCEKEIKRLVEEAKKPENSDIAFAIVTHSVPTFELEQFIKKELHLQLPSNVYAHGDPERRAYAAYGLGELSATGIVNNGVLSKMGELKKEGVVNRLTRGTRWQTNGGFALDAQRIVKYAHIGKDSGDVTDLQAALSSIR